MPTATPDGEATLEEVQALLAEADDLGLEVYEDPETGTVVIDTGFTYQQIND